MTRKLSAFLLAMGVLFSLAGCAGEKTESAPPTAAPTQEAQPTAAPTEAPTPAPTEEPAPAAVSFAEAFDLYQSVFNAAVGEIQQRIATHNGVLESRYPDSYYMNSSYLMQPVLPVWPVYPVLGSALADDAIETAGEAILRQFPDAELLPLGPGSYAATYTYVDKTSGEEVPRAGRCSWECEGSSGAFRVRAWVDDSLVEFTEFIPQGDGRYLIYTSTDALLVQLTDEAVSELWFAHRINESPLGSFPGDVRLYSLDQQDFYPAGTAEESWILSDENAQYTLALEAGDMTFTGKVSQDVLNDAGEKTGLTWQSIDSILLLK